MKAAATAPDPSTLPGLLDLRRLEDDASVFEADVCIVGSGPAGLAVARGLAGLHLRILVVESGGLEESEATDRLSEIESVGFAREMAPRRVRNRVFGGTSESWTGRCAPFDPIDFERRDWVARSGWPISRAEVMPWLERAAPQLGISTQFDPVPDRLAGDEALRECVWQFSRGRDGYAFTQSGREFLAERASDAGLADIRVLLHATVREVLVTASGRAVEGVEVVALSGRQARIRTPLVVLAGGGIENARMLLLSRRVMGCGIGNGRDQVGRHLMDHPRGVIAAFDRTAFDAVRARYGLFRLPQPGGMQTYVRGLTLSPETQAREGLLNCAAWITEERAEDDPWEAAKRLRGGRSAHPLADTLAIARAPRLVAAGLAARAFGQGGVPHKLRGLVLDCIVEQVPDPDSRILLGERRDPLGLPVAVIDWRIDLQARRSAARLARYAAAAFARLGVAPPRLSDWIAEDALSRAQLRDVAHPMGTTRMSATAQDGVVDTNGQVHGVHGLFIAGSSVFPTSGHANPTLMIVGLATRLAFHLRGLALTDSQAA